MKKKKNEKDIKNYMSSFDLSRYSRSIKLSIRFLIKLGLGENLAESCFVTSAIKLLCSNF